MGKLSFLYIFLFLVFSCEKRQVKEKNANSETKIPYYVLDEEFIDSITIGEKGNSKVVIRRFKNSNKNEDSFDGSSDFVTIQFFNKEYRVEFNTQKEKPYWNSQEKFYFDKDGILSIQPLILDFNNDGFSDFAYQSAIAARGSNEVKNLFIYDPSTKEFSYIKNSEQYPNLSYNKELNCIESFIFTGTTTTVFLNLKKDSLKEFASVDFANTITVYENDESGERILINEIPTKGFDAFVSFKNYKPLMQYTENELNQK